MSPGMEGSVTYLGEKIPHLLRGTDLRYESAAETQDRLVEMDPIARHDQPP